MRDADAPGFHGRRSFLARSLSLAAAAAARATVARLSIPALGAASGALAACGSSDPVPPTVVALFSPDHVLVAGRAQRIPIAIVAAGDAGDASSDTPSIADDAPIEVTVRFEGDTVDELSVAGHVVDHDHVGQPNPDHQHANLFRYYPLRTTLPTPGIYDLDVVVGDAEATLPVQAFDPAEVGLPLVGDPFPAIATPTFDEPAGVDRLCTRFEPCPFHQTSADQLLTGDRPLAVLVATPAFCSTAYCGPVLETLIAAAPRHPGLDVVHVEVYANPDEVDGNFTDPRIRLAPAVAALGLGFEPALFLVDAGGVVVDRIDNVFDRTELDAALTTLVT